MMKTLLNTLFLLIVSVSLMGQQTSRLIPIQANPLQTGTIPNLLGWRYEIGDYRIYAFDKSGLKIGDSVRVIGDGRYYLATNPAGFISNEADPIWNAQKVNYPTTAVANGLYYPLSANPSSYVTSSSLSTTLSSYATTSSVTSGLNSKEPIISNGTSSQYYRGDKTWQTLPSIPTNTNQLTNGSGFITAIALTPYSTKTVSDGLYYPLASNPSNYLTSVPAQAWVSITGKPTFKKQETFSGTTNASGVYTVTFATAYAVAPNIQANIVGGTSNQVVTMTVTTTGFTCTVVQRSAVTLLTVEVLLAATTPVNNANLHVLITER